MGAVFVLALFMTFLFGAGMLVLVMGYLSTEQRRAQEEKSQRAEELLTVQALAMMPRFFPRLDAIQGPPVSVVVDDRLLADLESYVRAEQALVTQFVAEPSIDSLYRRPSAAIVN